MRFVICLLMAGISYFAVPQGGWIGISVSKALPLKAALKSQTVEKKYNAGRSIEGINVFDASWAAILKEADIKVNFLRISFIKRNEMFLKGDIAMMCCSIPTWHNSAKDLEVQLFSAPFFSTYEHVIYRESQNVNLKNSGNLKAALVVGFTYKAEPKLENITYFPTIYSALMAVELGEADFTIINSQELGKFQRQNKNNLVLGEVWDHIPMAIRIRKEHAHLLPKINNAIQRLRARGEISRLVGIALREQVLQKK